MTESSRLLKIESNLAHLEQQYEELNRVVIEQGKALARLQKDNAKMSDTVQTIELASPPPKMPSSGSPKWPKIKPYPSRAFITMPARLIASTHPGRSSAATKLRIAWKARNGNIDHM